MQFREATLDNGLEVIAECNDAAHTSALGYFVKTGARDETDAIAGVSHFLEHMVFKGTPNRTADDVNREFDELGAHYNAFTSEENTVYYASYLPEFQEQIVGLWADVLRPSLREEDFNTEKKVIIEEIRMYDDQPPFGADDICKARFFGDHPLARSVLGSEQSVSDLDVNAMRDYFLHRYSPRNITLVASGKVDFDALVESAQQHCGHWDPFDAPRDATEATGICAFETLTRESAVQEYLLELAIGPSATDPMRYAAKLLTNILGDDSGSRLYWELVDPGLAEHAGLGHYEYDGTGVYMTYMSCQPEQAAANAQRILDVYRAAEEGGVTADELSLAKAKTKSRIVLGSERPRNRLFNVGGNWQHRHAYRTIAEDLKTVDSVTIEAIAEVLAKYPITRNTSLAVGPLAEVTAPQ